MQKLQYKTKRLCHLLFEENFDPDLHKKYRQGWQSMGQMPSSVTYQGITKIKG